MLFRIGKKIKEVGILNFMKGFHRNIYYRKLRKQYGFEAWHESPYEWREYAQLVAGYVNKKRPACVVDMGCGLGEVIRNIKAEKRIGYDPSGAAVEAARVLDKSKAIFYRTGSFEEFQEEEKVDYFIALGFMHGSGEDTWRPAYHQICERCEILSFIVDVFPKKENWHQLDFTKILPPEYILKDRMGPLLGGRMIEVYEKKI